MSTQKKINFIDLFAGCGGLSEGFYRQGFNALAHVEIDSRACETLIERMQYYKYENPERYVLNEDITQSNICEIIDKVTAGQNVDVLIGGPPCQAYSTLGRAKDKDGMQNDPRNYLFESYAKVLNYYKPKFFIFENVLGILSAIVKGENIIDRIFRELGENYNLCTDKKKIVLNAVEYGVPQIRKRVIIIGVRKDLNIKAEDIYSSIKKTHYAPGKKVSDLKEFVNVRDAISDLPKLLPGEESSMYCSQYRSDYIDKMRQNCNNRITSHVARRHNKNDIEIYKSMAQNKWALTTVYEKRPELVHFKKRLFNNSYWVQNYDEPSRTIIAHLHKDGNQFIHPDYEQGRSLTVREAARLQSFPDNFVFKGSRTDQFKQVGNAVPPFLAEAIAVAIKSKIKD